MAEQHVIGALRKRRAKLSRRLRQLKQQLAQHRADLAHLDATMRLFDAEIRLNDIRGRAMPASAPGECLRLIYDELREAIQPATARERAERIMRRKAMPPMDDRGRDLLQRTLLSSLNRVTTTITRVETAGVVSWRLI